MLKSIDNRIRYNGHYCQQCGACMAICPKNAISFQDTTNGLKHVVVDYEKCICCKKCVSVCPSNRECAVGQKGQDEYIQRLSGKRYFFAWNSDEAIRRNSSSGGATRTIIVENLKFGTVDGVYSLRKLDEYPSAIGEFYTKDNIPSYGDLPNSVYHPIMACTEIKKIRKVHRLMIIGTSCQLYALEKALKGKYDELIKVCIFCKQQKTFDSTRFLAKVMGVKIPEDKNISIRYRGEGWQGIVLGRRLWTVPGCNICGDPFGMDVEADISMMDPWTIRKGNSLGETLVTVHTERGLDILRTTSNLCCEEKTYTEIFPALGIGDIWRKRICIPYFRGQEVMPIVEKAAKAEIEQRKMLEYLLENTPRMPIICYRILNKLLPKKRDKILACVPDLNRKSVKVITRHTPSNYGSLLQSIATQKVLEHLGCHAEIINYQRKDDRGLRKVWTEACKKSNNKLRRLLYTAVRYPIEKYAESRFDNMRSRYLSMTKLCCSHEELSDLKADIFMTGSDQVWGPMVNGTYDSAYFLSFVKEGHKTAYAASFGKTQFDEKTESDYKMLLASYSKIAVREDSAMKLLLDWGGENCIGQVLDPTLLLDSKTWEKVLSITDGKSENDYILIYQIHNDPRLSAYAKGLARIKNMRLVRVNPFLHQCRRGGAFKLCPDVKDFILLIKNAKYVVTDSFHGTCFAINFNVQFIEILPNNATGTRNQSILTLTGLSDRIVVDFNDYSIVYNNIDYEAVNDILDKERKRCLDIMRDLVS